MRPISTDQSHSVMQVLATNVDWNKVDPIAAQEIIRDKKGSGKRFLEFINNCGRSNYFIIGDAFLNPKNEGYISFIEGEELFQENKYRIVSIPDNTKIKKLKESVVREEISDLKEYEFLQPGFMTENDYFLTLYFLLKNPSLGKSLLGCSIDKNHSYTFYVEFSSGKRCSLGLWWGALPEDTSKHGWVVSDYGFGKDYLLQVGEIVFYY